MVLALALSSCLSAVPHTWLLDAPRAARLAVPKGQVADAPVDQLTLPQLHEEQQRLLEDRPGVGGPIALISVGATGSLVFGFFTGFFIDYTAHLGGSFPGRSAFTVLCVGAGLLTAIALTTAVLGTVGLIRAIGRREPHAQRSAQLVARIDAIESGQASEPLPSSGEPTTPAQLEHQRGLFALEESRPGLGLPLGLVGGGLGATVLAVNPLYSGRLNSPYAGYSASEIVLYSAVGAVAVGLLIVGTVMLVNKIRERAVTDEKIAAFKRDAPAAPAPDRSGPPPSPPPSPLRFSWASTFQDSLESSGLF